MQSINVLIVEDDPMVAETVALCFCVCWPEATVQVVPTGEEALTLIENRPPTLVILDLGLPGIDGYQTLDKIRAFSDIPVILLTAREGEMARLKGLDPPVASTAIMSARPWPWPDGVLSCRVSRGRGGKP